MERSDVENVVSNIKRVLQKALKNQWYETALNLVSSCAYVLYDTNIYYMDSELEAVLQQLAQVVLPSKTSLNSVLEMDPDTVLFYDGFGLDNRGLAKIYLKAIGAKKRICYVSYQNRSKEIPEILNIVHSFGGSAYFLKPGKKIDQINQLNNILQKSSAGHFFLYTFPSDVVATTLLYSYEGLLNRYQINLTDHAFWLGAGCMDICIEFREYGASISAEYRKIPTNKIALLPFYPSIDRDQSFLGFPFAINPDSKVVFSGGALYKTLGKGNKYYEIVDYLLWKHQQAVFWYAGAGDETLMKKLMDKYPGRLFLTRERKDLFPLLQNCYFYLSTYPICGGLMYQYAACAGKVPLTLRSGDINDGFLLNQEKLGIEFDTLESIKQEIDQLMEDESYTINKGLEMTRCVITPDQFQEELFRIMERGESSFQIHYKSVDIKEFGQIYLDNLSPKKLTGYYVKRNTELVMLWHFPIRFLTGVWNKVYSKIWDKLFVR